MRQRKRLITNLYLKDKDIKKLTHGYVVYKSANKHAHAIIPRQLGEVVREKKTAEKVAKLEARLAALKAELPNTTGKRKYTFKNKEFWANGGNAPKMIAKNKAKSSS